MRKLELSLLFVLIPLFSFAQLEDTKFTITDGLDNTSLKTAMEHNVSAFLKACNVAVMEGDKPEMEEELTDDAKDVLKQMWKTSHKLHSIKAYPKVLCDSGLCCKDSIAQPKPVHLPRKKAFSSPFFSSFCPFFAKPIPKNTKIFHHLRVKIFEISQV